nr:hypothetical protein BaRGS_029399 [Batillaria attramentaria]
MDFRHVLSKSSLSVFLGGWERMQTTTYFWGNKTYQSEVLGHFITISGSLLQYYRGYDPLTERCLEPGAGSMVLLDTPGDYLIISRLPVIPDDTLRVLYRYVQRTCVPVSDLVDTVPVDSKFLYASDDSLVLYTCLAVRLDGSCYNGSELVEVFHRTVAITDLQLLWLRRPMVQACVDIARMEYPVVVVMKILYTDNVNMLALWCHLDDKAECHPDRTTVEILSKNLTIKNSTMEELLSRFDDSCLASKDWMASVPGVTKILYADNDIMAALTCPDFLKDNTCDPKTQIFVVMVRDGSDRELDKTLLGEMHIVGADACVTADSLVEPSIGGCSVPDKIAEAVQDENRTFNAPFSVIKCAEEFIPVMEDFDVELFSGEWQTVRQTKFMWVSSGGEKSISCRVQDIPLATNFKFLQMTGYWYEIARTRFTFNTMESTISYYEFNPEKNYLDGLFIGTLQRQCQSALKSVTKKKFPDGPDSIITGRIQGPESIFPWNLPDTEGCALNDIPVVENLKEKEEEVCTLKILRFEDGLLLVYWYICDRLVSASSPEVELASCSVDFLPSVNPDLDKVS